MNLKPLHKIAALLPVARNDNAGLMNQASTYESNLYSREVDGSDRFDYYRYKL